MKYNAFQIAVVSECTLKRLGYLPFEFEEGTCGTFMIRRLPAILLCFDLLAGFRKCRFLTRRKEGSLSNIKNFVFDLEFEIDIVDDSMYDHYATTLANYQGFPLILGGTDWEDGRYSNNNKLEMLDTFDYSPRWVAYEGTHYPYSNK